MFNVNRDPHNPLIAPDSHRPWMGLSTFNATPIVIGDVLTLLYRASGKPALYRNETLELSVIGKSRSTDGQHFDEGEIFIEPAVDWDLYGCEDPRTTLFEGNYYTFYTAIGGYPYGPDNIKIGVAVSDDMDHVSARHLVTPFNAKAMALFPERINGKITAILTVHSDLPPSIMAVAQFDSIEEIWSHDYWQQWYKQLDEHAIRLQRSDSDHAEVGGAPILTDDGWLLIYSHIQDYFTDRKTFGIEAVLLERDNPHKIVRRTNFPFMVPEENYERFGVLPNIIFPSGVVRDGDRLSLYYGATDSTVCRANFSLSGLTDSMTTDGVPRQYADRYDRNPVLLPIESHAWESSHVLNPTAFDLDGEVQLLYRAVGPDNTSTIGLATSKNGYDFEERLPDPIYAPRAAFELKGAGPTDNSGCEDARVVRINDRLYITYTAFNSVAAPQVAVSSISIADYKSHNWQGWTMPELLSPNGIDDKDACILPKQVKGEYLVLHRVDHHVCADYVAELNFGKHKLTRCIQMFGPRRGMWDSLKVGIDGPPIETGRGWILLYHGISSDGFYNLGAVLLDLDDPTVVIGRTSQPIMTPLLNWEKEGWIPNVIFSCGQVVRDGLIYIYYGGADHVIGVATIKQDVLLDSLTS